MKALRWLVALLVVLALPAIVWLLWLSRSSRAPEGAQLLPADTFLFVQVRDMARARADFQTTALYQIWSEPDVQDFLGRGAAAAQASVASKLDGTAAFGLARRAWEMAEGECFVAVPDLSGGLKEMPPVLLGVDVKQRRGEAEKWLAELKETAGKKRRLSEQREKFQRVEIVRWQDGDWTLSHAWLGSLLLVGNENEPLRQAIRRARENDAASLARDPRFQNARQRMPADHAVLAYLNPQPLAGLLQGPAVFVPQLQPLVKSLRATRSVSYSCTMKDGSFHDVVVVDAPTERRDADAPPTSRRSLALTTESTLFYSVKSENLAAVWAGLREQLQQAPVPRLQEAMFQLDRFNRAHGCNLPADLFAALGPEYAALLSWNAEQTLPELFLAVELRDKGKAEAALQQLWQVARGGSPNHGERGSNQPGLSSGPVRVLPLPALPVRPAYAVTDQFLLLALQEQTLKNLLARGTSASKTLADAPLYQRTMNLLPAGGQSYVYLDTATLFQRAYERLEPLLRLLGRWVPDAVGAAALEKLPPAESIAPHLRPSAAAQVADEKGTMVVVISPVGIPTLAGSALVAAAAVVSQQLPELLPSP